MCIATVYHDDADQMKAIMQDVVSVDFENDSILLTTLLGETKLFEGQIKHIDFLKHLVIVESG